MAAQRREDYVCVNPFTYLAPFQDRIDACCSDWCDVSVPYNAETKLEDCWNSEAFKELRKDMLEGNYKHCNQNCPFLGELEKSGNTVGMFVPKEDVEKDLAKGGTGFSLKPPLRHIKFCSDETCNLHCKTCRRQVIVTRHSPLEAQFKDLEESDLHKTVEIIDMLGSGEVFVSRACLDWFANFDPSRYPNLQQIHLHTNAQLFNSLKVEKAIPYIRSVEVSIDAATKETYERIRRGGNWERLKLKITSMLDTLTECTDWTFSFVIQKWNVQEICKFYDYWKQFVRSVKPGTRIFFRFSPAEKWGIDDEEYEREVNIRNSVGEYRSAVEQINRLRSLKEEDVFVESSL